MAKQDFTAGQILTAAQMDTLQTNDYNWTSTTKTANYTLVAADAGTIIVCNSATPFAITLNQNVFAANDTVRIYNAGTGAVTVAAGTATFAKAGNNLSTTATLYQYSTGTIYWTSATGANWQSTGYSFVDSCETGTISGGVISAPTNYTVTFATGRFNVAPRVTASTYGGQKAIITFTNDPQTTTSGFTVTVEPFSGSTITRVVWVAVQAGI
jgi:hypothetical protein